MARLTDSEIATLLPEVSGWVIVEEEDMKRLRRTFNFDDFGEALNFTVRVGAVAETEDHHPRITTEWGRVTVTWWSHDQGGIVAADFEMAKRVDDL